MIIEMFPAKNGDAFLIRLDNKKNILIDMGYMDTYKMYIKDRLKKIKSENQCIDLLVITHIDEDHIEGAIEFIKENGNANDPNIIEIKEIWHNSYRHLQFDKETVSKITSFEERRLEEIKLSNSGISRKETNESQPVSGRQGSTLAGYLFGLGYEKNIWNASFKNEAVKFKNEAVNLDSKNKIELGDAKIYILSPDTKKLGDLSTLWLKKLMEIDINFTISNEVIFDDAYEMYMKKLKPISEVDESKDISYSLKVFNNLIEGKIEQGNIDKSKSNGASISFILEYKNKKLLFLGDSHEDIIVDNLDKYKKDGGSLEFEAVKISHHGSLKNNYRWIEKIKSKRYLISTNGENHDHPSKEVIAKILQCNKDEKTFYFNYPVDICNVIDEAEAVFKENYKYSVVVGNETSSLQIEVSKK